MMLVAMDLTERSITLCSIRDQRGSRYVGARCSPSGDLVIEGQDFGATVAGHFGASEYEWCWTIAAPEVLKLRQALGDGDDVLSLLLQRFSGERTGDLGDFFKDHEIAASFWSRVGE